VVINGADRVRDGLFGLDGAHGGNFDEQRAANMHTTSGSSANLAEVVEDPNRPGQIDRKRLEAMLAAARPELCPLRIDHRLHCLQGGPGWQSGPRVHNGYVIPDDLAVYGQWAEAVVRHRLKTQPDTEHYFQFFGEISLLGYWNAPESIQDPRRESTNRGGRRGAQRLINVKRAALCEFPVRLADLGQGTVTVRFLPHHGERYHVVWASLLTSNSGSDESVSPVTIRLEARPVARKVPASARHSERHFGIQAGDQRTLVARVTNASNKKLKATAGWVLPRGCRATPSGGTIELNPGETQAWQVRIQVPKQPSRVEYEQVALVLSHEAGQSIGIDFVSDDGSVGPLTSTMYWGHGNETLHRYYVTHPREQVRGNPAACGPPQVEQTHRWAAASAPSTWRSSTGRL
jgi:hypothetical protein